VQRALSGWTATHPATSAVVIRLTPAGTTQVAGYRVEAGAIPASTMKLVTTAGALLQFGPRHRFTTTLYAAPGATVRRRVLRGTLYLRGAGDPQLATRSYAARYLEGRGTSIGALALPLRREGVRGVRGRLVADESLFDSRRMGPTWPSYYSAYAGPLSALPTNQDYAGNDRARYTSDPPLAAAQRLRAALRGVGIVQAGALARGVTPDGARVLSRVRSPRLSSILRGMNLASDNFVAETIAKDVGAYGAGRGTTAAGVARTRALLAHLGIMSRADRLVDGSGLSRQNRLTAGTLARLVAAADRDPRWGGALLGSLAHGGQGTLIHRFTSGPARLRVRAKTGYIDGAAALAGRVVSVHGERYAFAMLMNTPDIYGAHAIQDRIVTMLAAGAEDTPR
jgi:serine-type D-Ala-D-Ala carboxypeptidase/endopeptidase (penicillin-binding protein 4)